MRVLLVEDDKPLSNALAVSLQNANYVVDCVFTGHDALVTLQAGENDIVILDLGLPDMDGLEVLKSIRKRLTTLPVLILTARDKTLDKISGLDAGADDYLPKPFEIDELLARLRVLERRLGTASQSIINVKNVSLDTAHHTLTIDGNEVHLPRRELMVLKALIENAGRILSKHQLESKLYEWGEEVASNTIEVHISHLRKKMPENFIKTIRGVGYCISKSGD
ncbi:DNA-binding response regulator [Alteromonas sp. KUL42]|uniref:response regulator n=1 Tax=Alteromonas sp. KUL42 TaxID=2480797 RepID=UPI00079CB9EF|nr:response regulator transcription factor [Alteromonas sp. KUL42]KXJ61244.1 MAG: XRE family transcriptional regulator [Alteromonas sp. Nap_26]TAP34892.1 response regulator transcription factor [Alteromonas sp. KUL42]GEA07659.1 DNA-binding response regulator [Alteromonas sp. KUL42]